MHLGEDAELYALGLLPLDDRPRIEAHLAGCDLCRKRVIDAEQAAWRMSATLDASAQPRRRRRRPLPVAWAAGIAAVFALGFGVQSVRLEQADAAVSQTGAALAVVASSHFDHVTMTPIRGTLVAKVLYAKDRTWVYCIVDDPRTRYVVRLTSGGTARDRAQTGPTGSVSQAFVSGTSPIDDVALVANGAVVASAHLAKP
jgi:hypothetical protein